VTENLKYETLERLKVSRPVDRIAFIAQLCMNKRVLDIGCLDETALMKQNTDDWLHRRIGMVAQTVIGIDSSERLPDDGVVTGVNSRIIKGDGVNPALSHFDLDAIDIVVAGEFIEHLENPLTFLRNMRQRFPGRQLIISTPNGVAFANALLAAAGAEAQHPDHLLTSTYKTLNTLCRRSGCVHWRIIPYRFYATEMLLKSSGFKRYIVLAVEQVVRLVERIFPLRSFGYIVQITL
jgi:2-polyprenyl-3-methyl-5-hydroxy-6-metoxy-1,4-benzoquinol methylase